MDMLAWYNLVFELPFVAGLIYLLLLSSGLGVSEHEAEVDFDHDIDVHGDFDHQIGIEHSTEFEHGHDHEVGHNHEPGTLIKMLSFFGLGRVPISIILMNFCFLWGFSGWASNQILKDVLRIPELYFWISLAVAAASSIFGTSFLSRALMKIMPGTESYGSSNEELVGKRATARFSITATSGTARLYDQYKNMLDVSCRVAPGEAEIPDESPVVLLRYDPQERSFIVRPDPLALTNNLTRQLEVASKR